MSRRITGLLLAALLPLTTLFVLLPAGTRAGSAPDRSPLPAYARAAADQSADVETCAICHEAAVRTYRQSVHARVERRGRPGGCEACHGDPRKHVETGGDPAFIFSFDNPDTTTRARIERCLTCHGSDVRTFDFRTADHREGAVACSDCHKPHAAAARNRLLVRAGHEACLACHEEIRPAINLNERHRIKEGIVQCVDCHDQHGRSLRPRLGGFKQQVCTRCHTDKQGPFMFEHAAVRIEGCVACHEPHGSVNRHLLLYQSTARLCFSCHTAVPGFHSRFNLSTNCVNCHSAIHGSHLSPVFLR